MIALRKFDAFGVKTLSERTGCQIWSLYRYRRALADGRGVPDDAKIALIEGTRGEPDGFTWEDFKPARLAEAVEP